MVPRSDEPNFPRWIDWLIAGILMAVTTGAYSGAGGWGFVNLDDDAYVEFQPMVNQGLRPAAIVWAFTATHSNNWHPLTSLSHIVDCTFFGTAAGLMHWENVGWHILNAFLLYLVLRETTRKVLPSAAVAGFFAWHPAHVESVAWISERKDLLSTCFWLLALLAYARYARAVSRGRYLLVAGCFVLALLSKPMAVTLPLSLLLLDFWPLQRWPGRSWRQLVFEKIPLFAIAVAHSLITICVQVSSGAASYGLRLSFAARVGNAVISWVRYLGKLIYPQPLAPHYDHPGWWPWWTIFGATSTLFGVTLFVWMKRATRPWLAFGWAWFVLTSLPIIGLIQVGAQAMADRYTYVPYIGLFVALAWEFGELATVLPKLRKPVWIATACSLCILASITHRQAETWKDSITLYERSIAGGTDNATLRYLLAQAYRAQGRSEESVAAQYRRAIEISPAYTNAYTQLAILALQHQDLTGAEELVRKTVQLEPNNPAIRRSLGALRNLQNRPQEATVEFEQALHLDPNFVDAKHELAWMHLQQGLLNQALSELEAVVAHSPWDFISRSELGVLYLRLGRREDARRSFEKAIWINPRWAEAGNYLRQL